MKGTKEPPKKKAKTDTKTPQCRTKPYPGRMMWIDEETNALLEGIKLYGMQRERWSKTKSAFPEALKYRHAGQIKDRVRTMARKGMLEGVRQYLSDNFNDANPTIKEN